MLTSAPFCAAERRIASSTCMPASPSAKVGALTGDGSGVPSMRARIVSNRRVKAARPTFIAPPSTIGNCSGGGRSEEHTSELQSLMRISYAVFCLNKKKNDKKKKNVTY